MLSARGRAALVDYVERLSALVAISGTTRRGARDRPVGGPVAARDGPRLKPR